MNKELKQGDKVMWKRKEYVFQLYQQKFPEDITEALIFEKTKEGWRGKMVDAREVEKILEFDFMKKL
tara:strand:+ start:230 stop:430 length:201 start_codon:yes stop_codon:yes gene_type:complete